MGPDTTYSCDGSQGGPSALFVNLGLVAGKRYQIAYSVTAQSVTAPLASAACYWADDLRHVFNDVVNDVSYAGLSMRGEILGMERLPFGMTTKSWRLLRRLALVERR